MPWTAFVLMCMFVFTHKTHFLTFQQKE